MEAKFQPLCAKQHDRVRRENSNAVTPRFKAAILILDSEGRISAVSPSVPWL